MTTIVLTTLGILIAAASALMIVFYGGDLYSSGSVSAHANRYMNLGANVVAAVDQYRINERSDPASITVLVQSGYIKVDGTLGAMQLTRGLPGRFTVTGVPADVCIRINETLKRSVADASNGSGMSGCQSGTYYTVV